ncbi:MAG: paraquat-inducible protein A [Cycloclasticus sp.]|nr:paraquat-inducible protein A [Cycloclasticus sp.]MBQ0790213.1 paraquat-inducible protein A [Cycloclasticus sp.]
MKRKTFSLVLLILSIVFLVPGLTLPLMSIEATVEKQAMLSLTAQALTPEDDANQLIGSMLQSFVHQWDVEGEVVVFKSTRSLLGTMNELISHGHVVVGMLIGLFGVLIPLIKILIVLCAWVFATPRLARQLLSINAHLGKWSMSDVFVMSLIVTFLAINANEYAINTVKMTAEFGPGFYFFTVYCLLAIAASQLMNDMNKPKS